VPQIEVSFDIDANGILHVAAKDKATSKEQSIRITSSSGLSKEEVDRMKKEADEHAAEDKKKKDDIDLKNQADSLTFQTDKQLKEFGDKLSATTRARVEKANEALKEAIKSGNATTIRSSMEELNAGWNEASSQMYQSATSSTEAPGGEQGPPPNAGEGQKADGKKVEDAQYEVVDDKDKDRK
jgi:molecular chaperone DnaK